MFLTIVEFAGVTLGAKFLLGLVFVYYLLPGDHTCETCDRETLPLQSRRGLRLLARWCGLERRWCTRCGTTAIVRRSGGGGGVTDLSPRVRERARSEGY
jgi:hypothetical protein